MTRTSSLSAFAICWLLVGCLEIAETNEDEGSGGSVATGGGSGGAGGSGNVSSGGVSASGGSAGAAAGAGGGTVTPPFTLAELSSQRSVDSGPNAHSLTFDAQIPTSTRFLLACAHSRDNDTAADFYGDMTLGGTPLAAVDAPARGTYNGNQAGVQCFYQDDPPAGSQPLAFTLTLSNTYDYLRISAYFFSRPAVIHAHKTATHSTGNTFGDSISTTEPALVLAIYTRYYSPTCNTAGFTELFDESGFGGEAIQYAASVAQTMAGTAAWSVAWSGSSSWGGSQLVAIAPK